MKVYVISVVLGLIVIAGLLVGFRVVVDSGLIRYECGFDAFSRARRGFSFRFYLVAVLFLVFDVEIVLILVVPLIPLDRCIIVNGGIFLAVLMVGVVYEIYLGSLDWVY